MAGGARRQTACRASDASSAEEMAKWEADRIQARGDGVTFTMVFPDFEDYFEEMRRLAGEGENGAWEEVAKVPAGVVSPAFDGHELQEAACGSD